ncbi:MAG: plastocyanin/azurin family copper-binding protein [Candidatus Thermoplasmatota archaeon]
MRWLLAVALLAPLALSGCATPQGVLLAPGADGRYHIAMTSQLTFDPAEVRVPVGATVVWHNNATMVHDVAGYRGDPIKDDRTAFSSSREPPEGLGQLMQPGEEFAYTFAEKGAWTIWCHTHHEEAMKGVVHVV